MRRCTQGPDLVQGRLPRKAEVGGGVTSSMSCVGETKMRRVGRRAEAEGTVCASSQEGRH